MKQLLQALVLLRRHQQLHARMEAVNHEAGAASDAVS